MLYIDKRLLVDKEGRGGYKREVGGGGGHDVFDIGIEHVQHTERINVHRVLANNSMYSRSYSQHKIRGKIAIMGHMTG